MAAAEAAENHRDEWVLTWYSGQGRYIQQFQPEPTHKIQYQIILPWNISQMITRIVISYAMK